MIGARAGGIPDLIDEREESRTGYLVPPGDPDAIRSEREGEGEREREREEGEGDVSCHERLHAYLTLCASALSDFPQRV